MVVLSLALGLTCVSAQGSLPVNHVFLGVYDPSGVFSSTPMDVELYFIPPEVVKIQEVLEDAFSKGRVPIVTLEFQCPALGSLLEQVNNGVYDGTITNLAKVMRGYDAPVIVRVFHEMELVGNYCWAQRNTSLFVKAYRHFVDLVRLTAPNARFVWSPAGNTESLGYYPGDRYADYVGFTLLASDVWDRQWGLAPRSFKQLFLEKYNLLKRFGRMMIIDELGVSRPTSEEKKVWLDTALRDLRYGMFNYLAGVVYFNAVNAENVWTGDRPDWSITPDMFWSPGQMPKLLGR